MKKAKKKEELLLLAKGAKTKAVDILIEIGNVVANATTTIDVQKHMSKLQSVLDKYNNHARKLEEIDD